jgi:hypothetical protein
MGIANAGDFFSIKTDHEFEDIQDLLKIVDDMLLQGEHNNQTCYRVRIALGRARRLNLKLSLSKFEIGPEVKFAGHLISAMGIRPDPDRTRAIRDFPAPRNVSEVRSLLGMVNQLAIFHPDLAQLTSNIRSLLKKGTAFAWMPEQDCELQRLRELIASDSVVKPFDPELPTTLYTDASRLGLGYALLQHDHATGAPRLIHCGSCSLTGAQANYAVIELEALAVQWALDKCRFFLLGCEKFAIKTDHKPLVGVFAKAIPNIDNPRLLRVREKTSAYSFSMSWVEGKDNVIADALSRRPVFPPNAELDCEPVLRAVQVGVQTEDDLLLDDLRSASLADADYVTTKREVTAGQDPSTPFGRQLVSVWPRVSADGALLLVDGHRIVPPTSHCRQVLELLHEGHPGVSKALANASQTFFWPGLCNEITQFIHNCEACQALRSSSPPASRNAGAGCLSHGAAGCRPLLLCWRALHSIC